MVYKLICGFTLFLVVCAESEDKKWVWGDNNRGAARRASLNEEASARYEVFENDGINSYPGVGGGFGIGIGGGGGGGGGIVGVGGGEQYPGPILNKPGNIPGGVYDINNQLYGDGHGQYYPNDRPGQRPGVLTGPVPSWQGEGPFKEFDRCKCTERFNCNSPGISYGHCDTGKRYCCYSLTKQGQAGGPLPSRPIHSPENGILVGPGGPVGGNHYPRPVGNFGGSIRPGSGGFGAAIRPTNGGFGLGGRPVGHGYGGQNIYSPENGVLVGPGGPSNRPNFGISSGFLGRTAANKND